MQFVCPKTSSAESADRNPPTREVNSPEDAVAAQVQALPLPMDVAAGAARFYGSLIIRTSSDLAPVFTSTVKMFPTPGAKNLSSRRSGSNGVVSSDFRQ